MGWCYDARVPAQVSASGVKRYRACPRKVAFKYSPHKSMDTGPATTLGREVHAVAEKYLLTGELEGSEKAVAIFQGGMHHLPAPGTPGLKVEEKIQFVSRQGPWIGFVDFSLPGLIGDHKTTSNMSYALTPETLREDEQANIYAAYALIKDPSLTEVKLMWVYYETKPKGGRYRSRKVEAVLTREEVDARMAEIEKSAFLIQGIHDAGLDPNAYPGNPRSCFAYNRPCEWSHVCEKEVYPVEDVDVRVANLLAQVKAPAPPPPPPPPPPPVADPINPPEAPPNTPELPDPMPAPASKRVTMTPERLAVLTEDGSKDARAEVKAYLVQEGVIESSCREGLDALAERARKRLSPGLTPEQALEAIRTILANVRP